MPVEVKCALDGKDFSARVLTVGIESSFFGHMVMGIVLHLQEDDPAGLKDRATATLGKAAEVSFTGDEGGSTYKGVVRDVAIFKDHLDLTAVSPSWFLDGPSRCRTFLDCAAHEAAGTVLADAGVDHGIEAAEKPVKFGFLAQYRETDFAFVCRMARCSGCVVFHDGKKLRFTPGPGADSQVALEAGNLVGGWGETAFHVVPFKYKGESYGYLPHKTVKGEKEPAKAPGSFKELASVASGAPGDGATWKVHHQPFFEKTDLENYLENRAELAAGGFFRFSATTNHPGVALGAAIKIYDKHPIAGGETVVASRVRVEYRAHVFRAEFTAIPKGAVADPADPNDADSAGRAGSFGNLQTAKVTDDQDPDDLGRVKIQFPWDEQGAALPWVRVAVPWAGKDHGAFSTPDIGDEVLVGFEYGDPSRPVVLGSLYHDDHRPDCVTPKGTEEVLFAKTPAGNVVRLVDTKDAEEIVVAQKDGRNEIRMKLASSADKVTIDIRSEGQINLTAGKGIKLEAKEKIEFVAEEIDAKANSKYHSSAPETIIEASTKHALTSPEVTVKANSKMAISTNELTADGGMKLDLKGLEVKVEGTTMDLKAGATMNIQSSAPMAIKSSLVQIN